MIVRPVIYYRDVSPRNPIISDIYRYLQPYEGVVLQKLTVSMYIKLLFRHVSIIRHFHSLIYQNDFSKCFPSKCLLIFCKSLLFPINLSRPLPRSTYTHSFTRIQVLPNWIAYLNILQTTKILTSGVFESAISNKIYFKMKVVSTPPWLFWTGHLVISKC